jgi:hypothetical protein
MILVAGDGEADAVGLLLREDDGGVDADDVAVDVEQRPAGVAGVDLGGRLDQVTVEPVFLAAELRQRAADRADDADAHAHLALGRQAVGVAERDRPLAATDLGRVGPRHRGQVARGDLEHGQVGPRVGADHDGRVDLLIVGRDPELFGVGDDVVVGQDVAVGIDDEARADGAVGAGQQRGEAVGVEVVGTEGRVDAEGRLGGGDRDHARRDALGDRGEAVLEAGEVERLTEGIARGHAGGGESGAGLADGPLVGAGEHQPDQGQHADGRAARSTTQNKSTHSSPQGTAGSRREPSTRPRVSGAGHTIARCTAAAPSPRWRSP